MMIRDAAATAEFLSFQLDNILSENETIIIKNGFFISLSL